jgi:hypothetical protein
MTQTTKPVPGGSGTGLTNSIADDNAARVATPDKVLPDCPRARQLLADRIAAELADAAIERAMAVFPNLGMNGLDGVRAGEFNKKQIATCLLFLHQCHMASPKRCDSSYFLKHLIERWGRTVGIEPYISNGCMIVAAVALGFPISRSGCAPANCWVGVRAKDVERLTKPPRWWS